MNKTTYERGLEQGTQQSLLRAARKKFGDPPAEVVAEIRKIQDVDRLEALIERVFDAHSYEELLRDVSET